MKEKNRKGKVEQYNTKYGNRFTYKGLNGPKELSKGLIVAKNMKSFLVEAKHLSTFIPKVSGPCYNVTLSMKTKNYWIYTSNKDNTVLSINYISNPDFILDNASSFFKAIHLILHQLNSMTHQAVKTILTLNSNITNLIAASSYKRVWEILNSGSSLESIVFTSYSFYNDMTMAQLYKLKNLKTLTLNVYTLPDQNVEVQQRKFFKKINCCHQLKHFEYKHRDGVQKKSTTLRIKGLIQHDDFISEKNFQKLFNLNVSLTTCSVDFKLSGSFNKIFCRLFYTKLVAKVSSLTDYELPWELFKEEEIAFKVKRTSETFRISLKRLESFMKRPLVTEKAEPYVKNNNSYFKSYV